MIDEEVDWMLKAGVIRPSRSPWASPVVIVPKKDGSTRFCVDLRRVNGVTIKDAHPLPNIQDIFDTLGSSHVYSTIDLRSAYWQVPLSAEAIPKTAFACHRGLFEFTCMAYGLCNAPGQFQRNIQDVLGDMVGRVCMVYLDDIIIFSMNNEEHREHMRQVLDRIGGAGLTLKLSKCRFGLERVELLGYTVSGEGIKPQADKVNAIYAMPAPVTIKEVRSFLGMTGYYHQCIPEYARVAEPLTALTQKHARFEWAQRAFEMLKAELCSDRVMRHPDLLKPYILHTDASVYAVGAILIQQDDSGIDHPVKYISKTLSPAQRKWAAIVKEAFTIIFALRKVLPYLQGARFVIYTDHKPLKSLFRCEIKNTMIQSWAMQITEFSCEILYRPGAHNVRADMLSRLRAPSSGQEVASLTATVRELDVAKAQRAEFPDEWAKAEAGGEGQNEVGDYVIIDGMLYSLLRPARVGH